MKVPPVAEAPVNNLLTLEINRSQQKFALAVALILLLISLASLPFASVQLLEVQVFQAAIFSTVICFELITAYVLYSQFRASGTPGLLVLAVYYLYSGCIIVPYLLTFPHLFSETGLFGAGPQSAIWIFCLWHAGLPLAILIYLGVERRHRHTRLRPRTARRAILLSIPAVMLGVSLITAAATQLHDYLPPLVVSGRFTPLFVYGVSTVILLLTIVALISFMAVTRGRTVGTAWLAVALLAALLEISITMYSSHRFSLGWYVAKWNSFVCSNIVLAAMIFEFTKMYMNIAVLYRQVTDSEQRYKHLFSESEDAKRTIAEQSEIIERMLESSREAIVMCDIAGQVVFANQRLEQYFERPLLSGQRFADYCTGMKLLEGGTLSELITAYCEENIPVFSKRISVLTHHEENRYYECYVSPIPGEEEGQFRGHLFGFRDRTDEERMDEIKNEFVSIISHEIRTPMSSIVGFIEILATREVAADKRQRYIETIRKEASRLANLINDFLDLQRMTSGRQEFHFKTLDAVLLLKEIVDQWQGKDDHKARLHAPTRSVYVHGDEDRLKQVFHNLISNAIKYSPGQHQIDIYVETDDAGKVLIKVQDYGLGIPSDALDKLFTRFYRVDNSDRRKIGGTGLGLSIVKEIVEAHHGKVVIDTELGKGSIFIVELVELADNASQL
ncbi:MASE4 domain-containing protein [Paenibacillus athensensis]|uniref:histidine kinase n=1 Tax=Paenibacillus athensensis TaxID=1967502 RepID=A0A4Y8PY23_9BACL|nr:MASE4 domain-containing protein [Paenibacillus athensensis]MCD1258036.1 MASE4 domain-containing protein [Paenibacillus athensensis]